MGSGVPQPPPGSRGATGDAVMQRLPSEPKTCSSSGCNRPSKARGLCHAHYQKAWKDGELPGVAPRRAGGVLDYFRTTLADMIANPRNECELWPYAVQTSVPGFDYGVVRIGSEIHKVSRLACEARHGECPPGLQAAHLPVICHTPRCWNPEHLRWATPAENSADQRLDGTYALPPGKLTEETVREIRARYAAGGVTQKQLAAEFGINQSKISEVVNRVRWGRVE